MKTVLNPVSPIRRRPSANGGLAKNIEAIISDMVARKQTFSAYDITRELRSRANSGKLATDLDVLEVGTIRVNGRVVPNIAHDTVKVIVASIFARSRLMEEYDKVHNGVYWQYEPARPSNNAA